MDGIEAEGTLDKNIEKFPHHLHSCKHMHKRWMQSAAGRHNHYQQPKDNRIHKYCNSKYSIPNCICSWKCCWFFLFCFLLIIHFNWTIEQLSNIACISFSKPALVFHCFLSSHHFTFKHRARESLFSHNKRWRKGKNRKPCSNHFAKSRHWTPLLPRQMLTSADWYPFEEGLICWSGSSTTA